MFFVPLSSSQICHSFVSALPWSFYRLFHGPLASWPRGVFFHHFVFAIPCVLHHALEVILPLVFFISSFGALALPLVFVIHFAATYFARRPKVVSTSSQTVCGDSNRPPVVFASRQRQCYHLNSSCAYNGSNVDIVQPVHAANGMCGLPEARARRLKCRRHNGVNETFWPSGLRLCPIDQTQKEKRSV